VRCEKELCVLQVQVLPGELSGHLSSYRDDQKGNARQARRPIWFVLFIWLMLVSFVQSNKPDKPNKPGPHKFLPRISSLILVHLSKSLDSRTRWNPASFFLATRGTVKNRGKSPRSIVAGAICVLSL